MPDYNLQYLFECHLNDGTIIQQTQEDVSNDDPARSAFYDVVQRINDIVVFGLYSADPNCPNTYVVDLRDGHFEINGAPIFIPKEIEYEAKIEEPDSVIRGPFEPEPDQKYELVFFRRHYHRVVMGEEPTKVLSHEIEYHLGWKTKAYGKEVQQTICVPS